MPEALSEEDGLYLGDSSPLRPLPEGRAVSAQIKSAKASCPPIRPIPHVLVSRSAAPDSIALGGSGGVRRGAIHRANEPEAIFSETDWSLGSIESSDFEAHMMLLHREDPTVRDRRASKSAHTEEPLKENEQQASKKPQGGACIPLWMTIKTATEFSYAELRLSPDAGVDRDVVTYHFASKSSGKSSDLGCQS